MMAQRLPQAGPASAPRPSAAAAEDDDIQDVTAEALAAHEAAVEAARVDLTSLDSDDDNPTRPVRRGSPPVKREA